MGRGDRKTTRGKIAKRSYGNARPHHEKVTMAEGEVRTVRKKVVSKTAAKSAAPAKKVAAKAPAKTATKAAAKKAPAKKAAKKVTKTAAAKTES